MKLNTKRRFFSQYNLYVMIRLIWNRSCLITSQVKPMIWKLKVIAQMFDRITKAGCTIFQFKPTNGTPEFLLSDLFLLNWAIWPEWGVPIFQGVQCSVEKGSLVIKYKINIINMLHHFKKLCFVLPLQSCETKWSDKFVSLALVIGRCPF